MIYYHVVGDLQLAQREAAVPHHSLVADVGLHAIQQRSNYLPFQFDANVIPVLPLYYVEQGGTKSAQKWLLRGNLTVNICTE